jgi:hypothetical protein
MSRICISRKRETKSFPDSRRSLLVSFRDRENQGPWTQGCAGVAAPGMVSPSLSEVRSLVKTSLFSERSAFQIAGIQPRSLDEGSVK